MSIRNEVRVVIVARFVAVEGKQQELLDAMQALMPLTRREPGCIRYELNQQVDNPRVLTYIEKFSDQASIDLHAKSTYITGFFADAAPRLAESFDVTYHREVLV